MRDIAILGAGGQAREIACLIEDINRREALWRVIGFVDKDRAGVGRKVGRYSILCSDDQVDQLDCDLVPGIGDPRALFVIRSRFADQLEKRFPNLIHPTVVMDEAGTNLGYGNVICAGSVLTTDIAIGSINVIGVHCTLGHDVTIGDGCVLNVAANISGNVTIQDECLIGTGAQVLQGLTIGTRAQVGAGAVVTKDVAADQTVVGVPARALVLSED